MADRRLRRKQPALAKGALAGALAGLAGAWAMNQFQALLSKAMQKQRDNGARAMPEKQEQAPSDEDGDATQKAATRIAHAALGRRLTRQEKDVAGPIVHYAFGCVSGALYGSAAELSPRVGKGLGLPFGAVLWLAADEVAVPAFRLSRPALDYPLSSHLSALAVHAIYGVATELARRTLRRVMSTR